MEGNVISEELNKYGIYLTDMSASLRAEISILLNRINANNGWVDDFRINSDNDVNMSLELFYRIAVILEQKGDNLSKGVKVLNEYFESIE